MSDLLCNKLFTEHHKFPNGELIPEKENIQVPYRVYFQNNPKTECFSIDANRYFQSGYFVGIDWADEQRSKVVYIEPKLNENEQQTNYLYMLFSALKHPGVSGHTGRLFEIKFDQPFIEIEQQHDLLTPLLVVQFLKITREIVRKGLKKSYYKVEQNLNSRVKGKVLVSKTIKQNLVKNRTLYTYCTYDEFGFNSLENRLLKKALLFSQNYLPAIPNLNADKTLSNLFSYIMPVFDMVTEDVSISEIKQTKYNAFYKEYEEAIRLAKLILQRFGYNLTNTQPNSRIKTPPFWIDMSKLFELYVLGLLKDRFNNQVEYHFTSHFNELDYLLNTVDIKMVVDAKYKTKYNNSYKNEDIRQVSGYARLKSVYKKLDKPENELINCLIIFPDQQDGTDDFKVTDFKK